MNIKAVILSFTFALFSSVASAGSGHDHGHGHSHEPVTQQQAEVNASRVLSTLVKRGVIDKSWKDTPVNKSEKKQFSGKTEWMVGYNNEAASDPDKRTLYIFLSLSGEYIAANYTGK